MGGFGPVFADPGDGVAVHQDGRGERIRRAIHRSVDEKDRIVWAGVCHRSNLVLSTTWVRVDIPVARRTRQANASNASGLATRAINR